MGAEAKYIAYLAVSRVILWGAVIIGAYLGSDALFTGVLLIIGVSLQNAEITHEEWVKVFRPYGKEDSDGDPPAS